MALLDTMKKVAEQSQGVTVPAAFLFGEVTATAPLTIRVDNRFDISGDAIVLTKEFKAGYYPTHTHTIDPHDHTVPQHTTEAAGTGPHTHSVAHFQTEKTGLTTNPEVYFGLAVGDKLALLRNHGGQSFLVLGRV